MSTFVATSFFDVAELAPSSSGLATAAFGVEVRPESTVLTKANDSLEPARVTVKVAGSRIDPEA